MRPLAVSTPKRSAVLPQVPTFTELGYPQVNVTAWYGLLARAGTPEEIIGVYSASVDTSDIADDLRSTFVPRLAAIGILLF